MSPKRWILLLFFYISYLMFGASIYYHIEHGLEREQRDEDLKERIEINTYLLDQLADKNVSTKEEVLQRITDYCGKSVTDYTTDEFVPPYKWTFYHSFFFAFTVCSTVGYGNISPTSTLGRMIMIAYSIIGIPINGILFAGLGEYFGRTFQSIYRRYKKYKMSQDVRYIPPRLSLITTVTIALIPGVTIFIFLPSWVFSYFEDWPYSLSVYYAYVTTTTIGFGDYVPTFQPHQPTKFGGWFVVYQIFIIVWFIFSLAYLLMIMTFITRGLQSKKLEYLEQQLSSNIKSTQNRIWNGVTKDVGYLRRILNELYIMKFKPVYTEPDISQTLHRSNSCPELTMYRVDPPIISRKRAFSECYDLQEARDYEQATLQLRTASDTDISKFDRNKSFECAEAFRQTTGLLAKVVSALATVKPPEDTGSIDSEDMFGAYHGFSDSQILASEWSFPSINAPTVPPPRRGRACSECNIHSQLNVAPVVQNEWTWSGDNNQIQQAINNRVKHTNGIGSNYVGPPLDYVVHMDDTNEDQQKQRVKKFSIPDGFRKLFPFKKRNSQSELVASDNGISSPPERKFSVVSVPETTQHRIPTMDYYSTVTANASPTYFRNGQIWRPPLPTIQQSTPSTLNSEQTFTRMQELFPSNGSLSSRLSAAAAANGANTPTQRIYDAQQTLQSNSSSNYQRNINAAARKRRASVFTQNPAIAARRGSAFPTTNAGTAAAAAAAASQRRSSVFNTERRGSGASFGADSGMSPRRGSLFPMSAHERRPSLFSVASAEDRDVLENTTLADLIRALEQMHTQAVLDETAAAFPSTSSSSGRGGYFKSDKSKRKMSMAGLDPPVVPPILSLFAGTNNKALNAAAANRLYARRATIVGTSPNTPAFTGATAPQQPVASSNILTRRRLSSVHTNEPPPSYSEQEVTSSVQATPSQFKRRFSIRPTALQIPPGKAPPPGVNINSLLQSSQQTAAQSAPAASNVSQRRMSLRPSPLAREGDATTDTASIASASSSTRMPAASSTNRLLAPVGSRQLPTMTSSTHSPLSRIVQISQAQRKSSQSDGFALERNKKSDGGK